MDQEREKTITPGGAAPMMMPRRPFTTWLTSPERSRRARALTKASASGLPFRVEHVGDGPELLQCVADVENEREVGEARAHPALDLGPSCAGRFGSHRCGAGPPEPPGRAKKDLLPALFWRRERDLNPRWVAPHTIYNPLGAVQARPLPCISAGHHGCKIRSHPPLTAKVRLLGGQEGGQTRWQCWRA